MVAVALAAATSCVPAPRAVTSQDVPPLHRPATARQLLQDLALDVPARALPTLAAVPLERPTVAPIAAAPAFEPVAQTSTDAARASDCLTAAVYYEARSEPADGQRAVAQVVLNRVRDRAFPHSVCGVVYQGVGRGRGCQFSFACDGSTGHPLDRGAWDRARLIAEAALAGSVYAPVGPATFYHTQAVSPWWAPTLARIGIIGAHIFYRWPTAMERALSFRQSYTGIEPGTPLPTVAQPVAGMVTAGYDAVIEEAGVSIHRGRLATATPALATTMATAPATARIEPTAAIRVSAGVRVHAGGPMPRHLVVGADGTAGMDDSNDAT